MKLVFFEFGPGPTMMATDVHDCEGMSDEELDYMVWEMAVEQAEVYGSFYLEGEGPSDEDIEDGLGDYFTDSDLDYRWELYDSEKHDQLRAGGGSFMDEFKND